MPVIIQPFSEENPPDIDAVNAAFEKLAGAINAIAGGEVVVFGTPAAGTTFLPLSGGTLTGTLEAPSMTIDGDTVLTTTSEASGATKGPLLQGVAVSYTDQTVTNPPTQTEVQNLNDAMTAILTSLRTAGTIDT